MLLTTFAVSLILAAFVGGFGAVQSALSLLAGTSVGLINFFLLARGIHAMNSSLVSPSKVVWIRASIFRYGLMFFGFAVCFNKIWFQILPFCLGVFLVQMVIVVHAFLSKEEK
jgi:hypothetical protein